MTESMTAAAMSGTMRGSANSSSCARWAPMRRSTTTADFTEVVRDQDAVPDVVGGDHPAKALSVLKPGGILISATFPLEQVGAACGAQDSRAGAPGPSSVRRYRRARQRAPGP
jgi:hypothetical protein